MGIAGPQAVYMGIAGPRQVSTCKEAKAGPRQVSKRPKQALDPAKGIAGPRPC